MFKCLLFNAFLSKGFEDDDMPSTQDQLHLFQAGDVNQGIWDTLGGPDRQVASALGWIVCQ